MVRFLPAIPGLLYATEKNTLFVNLFASNHSTVNLPNAKVALSQQTDYPWKGQVTLSVNPENLLFCPETAHTGLGAKPGRSQ